MSIYQSVLVIFFLLHLSRCSASLLRKVCPWILGKVITLLFISFFSSVGVNYSVNRKFLVSLDSGLTFFWFCCISVCRPNVDSVPENSWFFLPGSSRWSNMNHVGSCVRLGFKPFTWHIWLGCTLSIRTMFMFNNLSWNTEFSSHTAISSYQTLTFQIWWNISIFDFSSLRFLPIHSRLQLICPERSMQMAMTSCGSCGCGTSFGASTGTSSAFGWNQNREKVGWTHQRCGHRQIGRPSSPRFGVNLNKNKWNHHLSNHCASPNRSLSSISSSIATDQHCNWQW